MRYEHLSTPPETKSDEILKSSVEKLVPIPNECEVTSDNKSECDVPVCEDSSTCEDHSEILSDSNTDDISSNDDTFKDIEYVEASPLDLELVSLEEENDSSTSFLIFEESDNSLSYSDNSLPEFETFSDHTEETRSGSTTAHANLFSRDIQFFEELRVDDSITLPKNKSSNFDHQDDLSFPRPPPEPPDVEFFFDLDPIQEK
nr:hypothetical protein [Tanacetum cinerariifolium]